MSRTSDPDKRKKAAAMLAAGRRAKAVCRAVGVDKSTLMRWRADPLFEAEIQRRMKRIELAARKDVRGTLRVLRGKSLAALSKALEMGGAPSVTAALRILERTASYADANKPLDQTVILQESDGSRIYVDGVMYERKTEGNANGSQ